MASHKLLGFSRDMIGSKDYRGAESSRLWFRTSKFIIDFDGGRGWFAIRSIELADDDACNNRTQ